MRQDRKNYWLGGVLAAGLAVSVVLQGTAVTAYADEMMNEMVPQGIASAIVADSGAAGVSGGQNTGSGTASGKGSQIITAGSSNGASGGGAAVAGNSTVAAGNNTVAAGSSTVVSGGGTAAAGSGTIAAGSSGASGAGVVGPSVYGNIVTEGEKAAGMAEPILGGASLTMLNSQSESQMLSAILQTSQGNLIVVDGGLGEDGDYLRSQIQARGGHVSAWLITHPHGDHVGALYKILQDEASGISSGITIDGIYYSFGDADWYRVHDQSEQTMAVSIIGTFAGLPQTMLHPVSRGQTIQVDDVTIMVMNDRYELSNDPGNNATIVYKIMVNGRSILFLGDMGEDGGNRLLADVGAEALKSDIVQMAHHGQNGVSEAVYQAINPSICLWPTPDWLWNSSGNRYKIQAVKGWMSRLNVQRHYCMKDGDQVIY